MAYNVFPFQLPFSAFTELVTYCLLDLLEWIVTFAQKDADAVIQDLKNKNQALENRCDRFEAQAQDQNRIISELQTCLESAKNEVADLKLKFITCEERIAQEAQRKDQDLQNHTNQINSAFQNIALDLMNFQKEESNHDEKKN
jgi:chaperonin cofactor prefoldin